MLPSRAILLASLSFSSVLFSPETCNDRAAANNPATTPITKISYSTTGGRSGNYESLDVTADSLIYLQARRGDEKTLTEKTETDFWARLTNSINLEDFGRIKSNPGHALYDGIDSTLSIERGAEKHTVVNGQEDKANYEKIRPFTHLLEQKLAALRKKITW